MKTDLISTKTRYEVRECLATWMLPQIQIAFDNADVVMIPNCRPAVIGTRRILVERYYRSLNFGRPPDVAKFIRVCEAVLATLSTTLESGGASHNLDRAARARILNALHNDGYYYKNDRLINTRDAQSTLADPVSGALTDELARIEREIVSDPSAAMTSAMTLVANCCEKILGTARQSRTNRRAVKIHALVRRATSKLGLLPESAGAKPVVALLANLAQLCENLSKAPPNSTTGRPKKGRSNIAKDAQVKLVVGAATTLAIFLSEATQSHAAS